VPFIHESPWWVHTLQENKVFVRLDEKTLRHFDVLDTSQLKDSPDGETMYALNGRMRLAVEAFPERVVLKDDVRRDADSGKARHVRVTVDATKEHGFCLRHPYVEFDWAPDPDASLPMAHLTSNHPGMWRRDRRTHPHGAYAVDDDREGRCRRRSQRRDRSRSLSPPRAVDATWPTRASSSAVVALFGSARVRDVRIRASRGETLSAVANAWVEQMVGLRGAVERADG